MMSLAQERNCRQYVAAISSHPKRCYARRYLEWMLGRGEKPERPADVTHAAAQAVRMRLEEVSQ